MFFLHGVLMLIVQSVSVNHCMNQFQTDEEIIQTAG